MPVLNEKRHPTKLDPKFRGPFKISEVLDGDMYLLDASDEWENDLGVSTSRAGLYNWHSTCRGWMCHIHHVVAGLRSLWCRVELAVHDW